MADISPIKDKPVTRNVASIVKWAQSLRVRGVPLITGLEGVVFGTRAASEMVLIFNVKPPQYLWYMLSGGICDVLQFCMDCILHMYVQDSSTCWAVCFTASILFRHSAHRYLVFGNYVGSYYKSLLRMYCGYSVSIILSTAFNVVVTRRHGLNHYVAFVFTLLWTGIVNFFMLKKLWSFNGVKNKTTENNLKLNTLDVDVEIATQSNEEENRRTR